MGVGDGGVGFAWREGEVECKELRYPGLDAFDVAKQHFMENLREAGCTLVRRRLRTGIMRWWFVGCVDGILAFEGLVVDEWIVFGV